MALAEADFAPFPTTVLIADDDMSVRRLLRIAFEMDGYRTITAADGDEAVAAVRLHQPAVVIVDAAMPGCNGTAVTRAIRSELGWDPTVIMLTGRTDVADRLAAFECGVDDYLVKPVKVADLIERVRLHHQTETSRTSARLLGSGELYHDLRRRHAAARPVALVIAEPRGAQGPARPGPSGAGGRAGPLRPHGRPRPDRLRPPEYAELVGSGPRVLCSGGPRGAEPPECLLLRPQPDLGPGLAAQGPDP